MPSLDLPILRDGDLVLRPGGPDDADAVTAACQDAEIQRWTNVPSPYQRKHAVQWLSAPRVDHEVSLLAFAGGRLAGSFSLLEIDRERGSGEIGYWLAAPARGRGIAISAVGLLDGWARTELGLATIEILAHRDNAPSRRLAERSGFTDTGELRTAPRREDPDEPAYVVYVRKT